MTRSILTILLTAAVALAGGISQADVFNMGGTRNANGSWDGLASLELVPVGNPGNAGEPSGSGAPGGYGPDAIVGGVDYVYQLGMFEITAAQYTVFLNAVAKTDTYGLYNQSMWSSTYGCKIQRDSISGSYRYSVAADYANRPVNFVSWGDAARFTNWLHNDRPTGWQDSTTTEDGAYFLNGATSDAALMAVTRKHDAKYWIPSENEWYKAAYHKNDGVTGNYWLYPTQSDSVPSNQLIDPDPGNNATFYVSGGSPAFTIGSPYWRTEVGAHENSASPYGTFDQGGNLWEWNETAVTAITGTWRGVRGGIWGDYSARLRAAYRTYGSPTYEDLNLGFRVASVPEPGSIALLLSGALTGLLWWKRRR